MPQSNGKENTSTLYTLVLYSLGFLLLWEWLRPLKEITTTDDVQIFVFYALFLFIVTYFQLPMWISFPVKLFALLYALHSLYFFDVFLSFKWVPFFWGDLKYNISLLADRNWDGMTSLSRSFLFFVMLWLVSYLMHYWLIQTRRIFLFFLITVIYVTVLDTFTDYDAKFAIIRTVFIGLLLIGILRMMKIIEKEGFSLLKGKFPVLWVAPLTAVIALSSALGYIAPKVSAQWPDPVPFIQHLSGKGDFGSGNGDGPGNGTSKIGYGTNDTKLGGPFEFDYTPIFQTFDNANHYWRIETKEFYTGKGWENKIPIQALTLDPAQPSFSSEHTKIWEDGIKMEDKHAKVEALSNKDYAFLLVPGKLTKIDAKADTTYQLNGVSGKVSTFLNGKDKSLAEYEMDYQLPVLKEDELKKAANNYPDFVTQTYLQLPQEVPQRVKDLATSITKDQPTIYEKVKAVESYFTENGYGYNTIEVGVPKGNQDYVDQFLFETKKGYCDNFSTSMIVLLRSVGIPARWVKGFTPGTFDGMGTDQNKKYTITNANAHSWVEVYFTGIGWVPFEPTRGFTNPIQPEGDKKSSTPTAPVTPTETKKPQKNLQDKTTVSSSDTSGFGNFLKMSGYTLAIVVIFLIVVAILAFLFRKKWLRQYTIWRFKRKKGTNAFEEAFEKLLWLLSIYGVRRQPALTLREYAVYVDRYLDTKDMRILAKAYENVQFSPNPKKDLWNENNRELWENLIKRIRP